MAGAVELQLGRIVSWR